MKKQHKHKRRHKSDNKDQETADLYPGQEANIETETAEQYPGHSTEYPGHGTNVYDIAPAAEEEEEWCDCENETEDTYFDNDFESLKK